MTDEVKVLQAFLFVRGGVVTWKEAEQTLGLNPDGIRLVAETLQAALGDSGLTILMGEEGVELVTAPEMADLVAAWEEEAPDELSKAAAETLAIVAYRGPLSRQEISAIRGVESRQMLRQLYRRNLVRKLAEDNGVTLYELSLEALKQLGITAREELPDFELLSSDQRLQTFLQEMQR